MPIYDYRCNSCNKRVSLFFRSFSAAGNASCPSCGSADMKRIISAPTVLHSVETRAGRADDILRSGEYDMLDKRRIAEWSRKVGQELGGEAGARLMENVEKMEAGVDVPEMMDARYYADYLAREQKKDLAGEANDLTPSSDSGSSTNSSSE